VLKTHANDTARATSPAHMLVASWAVALAACGGRAFALLRIRQK